MINFPNKMKAFEIAVLSALRAAQLRRGCTPRVPSAGKHTMTALREVAAGLIVRSGEAINDDES